MSHNRVMCSFWTDASLFGTGMHWPLLNRDPKVSGILLGQRGTFLKNGQHH